MTKQRKAKLPRIESESEEEDTSHLETELSVLNAAEDDQCSSSVIDPTVQRLALTQHQASSMYIFYR